MNVRSEINVVANYFLGKDAMTPKKLQKIVYYAYSWYIVMNNDSAEVDNVLISDRPEAWIHGPVFSALYDKYKEFGRNNITKIDEKIDIDLETNELLDEIWNIFGKFDGDRLEMITHQEMPWKKARGNLASDEPSSNEINIEDIYEYYSSI